MRVLDKTGAQILGFIAGLGTQGAVPAVGQANGKANDVLVISRATGNPAVQRFGLSDGLEKAVFPTFTPAIGAFVAVGVF